MAQRFIALGNGYGDVYELITLIEHMPNRVENLFAFHTILNGEERTSIAASFKTTDQGHFQPIYICLEGIPRPKEGTPNQRYSAFSAISKQLDLPIIEMEVPPSTSYYELDLYFNQLISVLRLNHLLSPM